MADNEIPSFFYGQFKTAGSHGTLSDILSGVILIYPCFIHVNHCMRSFCVSKSMDFPHQKKKRSNSGGNNVMSLHQKCSATVALNLSTGNILPMAYRESVKSILSL